MTKSLLIGVDVGTTGAKAILCDATGQILAHAGQEYATTFRHPNWAEQDPNAWWEALCGIIPRALAQSHAAASDIAAVAVSSQAPTVAPVDAAGRPVYPALLWMDRRAEAQCLRWRSIIGDDQVAAVNGGRIDPYYLAPKLAWFREHEREAYKATHKFLLANAYIVHQLCGEFTLDRSHAPLTLFFDSDAEEFSMRLMDVMGIDGERLPALAACTEVVGEVTYAAAGTTGLAPGTPVLTGMVDATAAGLEAGIVRRGDAAEMTGQSTVLMIGNDQTYHGKELIPLGHAVPGLHLVVGALVATGGALRWFRDQLGEVERREAARISCDPFDLLCREAEKSPPGANRLVFLPYMYGERSPIWDSDARGVFFGLSLATQKGDLVRAIMEGAAYGLRHNVEVAARAGFPMSSLASVGGGTRSSLWNQIKADVLNRELRIPPAAAGAPMGDAIIAAVGAGLYRSVEEAVANMVGGGQIYHPRAELAVRYNALFDVYICLYPALRDAFAALARVPGD